MQKKRVGILELIGPKAERLWDRFDDFVSKRQFTGITPQAISVWCRQMGHHVHYAAHYGFGDPKKSLPDDLDVVFIAAHTPMANFAYALSKLYRLEGIRTVIGGPHAKSYPQDCQRYFDLVVLECDKDLIADIINDQFEPGNIISSPTGYDEPPTVEERLPEIMATRFIRGRPYFLTMIPMLASVGCPYSCNFCIDWDNKYRSLSTDRLEEDLRFISKNFPGVKVGFYDPNFGVRFDETMSIFERLPWEERNPYLIECSLTNLNVDRLKRLQDTKCMVIMPGIESWGQYSNKAGVGTVIKRQKLERLVEHFNTLREYIPYLQANFIPGLDTDVGNEPFELTTEFVRRAPFVWPYFNIPLAFGRTPLFDTLLDEGRILQTMPFLFYTNPYLTIILKNYDPVTYYEKMIDLNMVVTSKDLLKMRVNYSSSLSLKATQYYRNGAVRRRITAYQNILHQLKTDQHLLEYHNGQSNILPEVYTNIYNQQLGKYTELMPIEDSQPLLTSEPASPLINHAASLPAENLIPMSDVPK